VSDAALSEGNSVRGRIERFARLRAALRALAPSIHFSDREGLDEAFSELRGWLRRATSLAADAPDALPNLLARIDSNLDVLRGELFAHLRRLSLAQLRSTLPAHRAAHPEEVLALLDECLFGYDGPDSAAVLDYLITLLATESAGGRKHLACDPAELSAALAAHCAAAAAASGPESAELAHAFETAREELERGEPVVPIASRVRTIKRDHSSRIFAPEVLRALVAYNVAASNRIDDLEELERDLDLAVVRAIERSPRRVEPATPPAPAPDQGSPFESPGLLALARALEQRLAGTDPGPGPAAEIAALLDTGKLAKLELDALRESKEKPALRLAVVLGLVGRRVESVGGRLASLGIDVEIARSRWVPEISGHLSVAMQALVASDRYDDARKLADARNRFLSAWGEGATMPQSGAGPAAYSPARPRPAARARSAPPAAGRRAVARASLYAAALAIAVSLAGFRLWSRGGGNVDFYTSEQLAAISPHLETGYRDGLGLGKTFIGTVRDDFGRLPRPKREGVSTDVARSLESLGVREVFLFDSRRQLLLHWRDGRKTFPPPRS
jgi:hypothetical protein